jgi:crotonobetainyl-CoA:carnitine CoA-transferase CaiB-like acyl-CoA transferase
MPGIAPKLSETPGAVRWPGPTLGQHTDEVLTGLGLQPGNIAQLRRRGAVQ